MLLATLRNGSGDSDHNFTPAAVFVKLCTFPLLYCVFRPYGPGDSTRVVVMFLQVLHSIVSYIFALFLISLQFLVQSMLVNFLSKVPDRNGHGRVITRSDPAQWCFKLGRLHRPPDRSGDLNSFYMLNQSSCVPQVSSFVNS